MKQKELAIKRCASFLRDRIDRAIATGDKRYVTHDAIVDLLSSEFEKIPDGEEVKTTW
jgi:hypothetical protein